MNKKLTVYGIKNCSTMKKAFQWFEAHQIPFVFHDYKKEGITKAVLNRWVQQKPWTTLLNKKGLTWKRSSEERRAQVTTSDAAVDFMIEHLSSIKRPIIEQGDKIVEIGFDEEQYELLFQKNKG